MDLDLRERSLKFHKDNHGKIALKCKVPVRNKEDLTLAYTPGLQNLAWKYIRIMIVYTIILQRETGLQL